ncbi:MAG: cell division/cell wall cluster transcriptional repressor MraZ [Bacteroidales bacterium]|nr:cell division/cell wall cluster transcriptional repressor MraZ [Bacteroidales bacterium]
MSTFIGNIAIKADEKGRVFIPASYRKILVEIGSERIVMRRDTDNECLILYPEPVWNKKVEELSQTLDEWNPEDQMILMQFVSDAEYLEFDNQGRVLLQKRNLQSINAGSELLIVGMMNRFAIWDKETFAQKKVDQKSFAALLRKKMARPQTDK